MRFRCSAAPQCLHTQAASGCRTDQVVAANVDGPARWHLLNDNLKGTEWRATSPVVVLTKARSARSVRACSRDRGNLGVPGHVVSVSTGQGFVARVSSFAAGQTAVLLASSGVGKSSLVNALASTTVMATR